MTRKARLTSIAVAILLTIGAFGVHREPDTAPARGPDAPPAAACMSDFERFRAETRPALGRVGPNRGALARAETGTSGIGR